MDIKIPNLGDIDEVEVIEICVSEGDTVGVDDSLIVIESDKASMDVPCPEAGTIGKIHVSVGDMVKEDQLIVTLETGADDGDGDDSDDEKDKEKDKDTDKDADRDAGDKQTDAADNEDADADDDADGDGDSDSDEDARQDDAQSADADDSDGGETRQIEVLVPDIGDASGVVVIEIAVKAGDSVAVDDLLVVLESDKASMEIAAEHAGKVVEVVVEEGDEVEQGTLIARLEVSGKSGDGKAPSDSDKQDAADKETSKGGGGGRGKDGQKADKDRGKESRKEPEKEPEKEPGKESGKDGGKDRAQADAPQKSKQDNASGLADEPDASVRAAAKVYAGPAVRRLARELGVDLVAVKGSGQRGRIVKDDVKAHVKAAMQKPAEAGGGLPQVPAVDFSKFGDVETVDLSRIRQRGADNLHRSWVNLPHVTQHDQADVTDLEAFRQSLKAEAERKGIKVTPLSFIIKACCRALQEFPEFNASLHEDRKHLVMKKYINIGMAVDTPEGLVVPVIRQADQKNIWQLSEDIAALSAKARDKKLGFEDQSGGTFSVSSLGALGGTGFTPIVNAPEVAILGVSKVQMRPEWDGESFQPRQMLPLSLSYDHRVINGADGGRFMVFLTGLLSDIRRLAL